MFSNLADRWAIVRDALGVARYGLANLVKGVLALAALAYVYWYGHAMTWLESAGILGTVTFILLFLAMVEYCLKLTRQIREARIDLAKLRRVGVELRNFGRNSIADVASFDKWCADTSQWEKEVVAAIAKISAADAEWFAIMDSVPDKPRVPLKNQLAARASDHYERYVQHDFQVTRLGEMIRDLWGRQ